MTFTAMRCVSSSWIFVAVLVLFPSLASAAQTGQSPKFDSDILPIFQAKCASCHGESSPQAGLNLRTADSILKGGKSGPAVKPGSSAGSLLMEKVVSGAMPPGKEKLNPKEVALLRSWVDRWSGAGDLEVTESDVLPIFLMRCVVCHGKRKQEGGLDLRSHASRLKGGKSGPAIVPGKPEESLLMQKITSGQMPPPKLLFEYFVRPPTSPEVDTLRKWIAGGARPAPKEQAPAEIARNPLVSDKDREFWSFRPAKRPAVPAVSENGLVRNPIDAFLLEKLQAKNLSFSAPADRLVLLRRASLDLTGLPPSPAQIREYLNDDKPGAYERLIDRLLASPEYGERWAQFWLNAAGYSDSEGIIDEDRIRPNAWRYRDYVIRSFNSDKPYDQFLTEQIAGDELVDYKNAKQITPEIVDKLAATGFLRMAPDGTYSPANGSVAERMNVIADEIEVLSSSVLGLTVGCARCHNHKYDPIPQRDYYRLSAILQTAYDPYDWTKPTERNLDIAIEKERRETELFNGPIEAEIKKLEKAVEEKAAPLRLKVIHERASPLPESVRSDLQALLVTEEARRTPVQKYLADKFEQILKVSNDDLAKQFPEFKVDFETANRSIAEAKKKLRLKPQIRALYEMGGDASPAYLLRRGDAQSIGEQVQPGTPSVLSIGLADYKATPPHADSSGRRLALARWLVQRDHPLTARVMVNRIWMHHFGRGLVVSPSNFGRSGVPPSHPELLDWLATEFVRSGWSIKSMHRLMMTSAAYRQSSALDSGRRSADAENVLLSRMPLRRMDAEQLYDSILEVTGRRDDSRFGPAIPVDAQPGGEIAAKGSRKSGWRRAIYTLQRRTTPMTMLDVFDLPPMSPNCIERASSTVPTQALQMMNSAVVRDHARYWAGRLIDEFGDNQEQQIEHAYLRAFSRRPSPAEIKQATADIAKLTTEWEAHLNDENEAAPRSAAARWSALASFCHGLLNAAEFAYID
jgi:hypothetical protein